MWGLYARMAAFVALGALLALLGNRFLIEPSREGLAERLLGGHATLLSREIARTPPAGRHERARQLSAELGYPVRLEQAAGLPEVRSQQRAGGLFVVAPVVGTAGQLVLGPLPFASTAVWPWSLLLVLALSAPMGWLAVRPLLARVSALRRVAAKMGSGDFSVRALESPEDPLVGVSYNLNQLADRIDQLLSDERDLLRTVAHEVRAPISRMRFRVQRLEDQEQSADKVKIVTGLVADLQQVDALFEELLTYVAFDEFDYERPKLETRALPIAETVARVVEQVTATDAGVKVSIRGDETAKALANPKLFERAVTNLLLNAFKYGGPQINIFVRRFARECVVDVQDSGPGIPEEARLRVVKPFIRLAKKDTPGTGLGLAIVARIMALHQGRLHLLDAPSGGASVQLVWKSAEPEEVSRWWGRPKGKGRLACPRAEAPRSPP